MKDRFDIPQIQQIVSRQARLFESKRATRTRNSATEKPSGGPVIAISREPGAGGSALGRRLAARLGFELFDRSILDRMAGEAQIDSAALRRLEMGRHGAIHEAVYMTLDREYPGHHSYLKHLVAMATSLGARGRVILLGRGMHYILPAEWGVKARLVGSLETRIERVRRELDLDEVSARRWIEKAQRVRDDLVRNLFHRDPSDPHDYDMVLNTDYLTEETCADMVVDLLERRCGSVEDRSAVVGESRVG